MTNVRVTTSVWVVISRLKHQSSYDKNLPHQVSRGNSKEMGTLGTCGALQIASWSNNGIRLFRKTFRQAFVEALSSYLFFVASHFDQCFDCSFHGVCLTFSIRTIAFVPILMIFCPESWPVSMARNHFILTVQCTSCWLTCSDLHAFTKAMKRPPLRPKKYIGLHSLHFPLPTLQRLWVPASDHFAADAIINSYSRRLVFWEWGVRLKD